jgi:hypothetical protein
VKCSFQGETRVIRVRKDIPYNAFILKASEEFGLPLVVDTYEDAEGELITLGENGVIEDLGTQLSFGAKHRPYALKIYLRRAGTRRLSTAMSTQAVTGERRRSSEYAEHFHSPNPALGLLLTHSHPLAPWTHTLDLPRPACSTCYLPNLAPLDPLPIVQDH